MGCRLRRTSTGAFKIGPGGSVPHDLAVSIDDLDLQMRMDAADRADAPLDRPSHEVWARQLFS
jgi:hypothetical protein